MVSQIEHLLIAPGDRRRPGLSLPFSIPPIQLPTDTTPHSPKFSTHPNSTIHPTSPPTQLCHSCNSATHPTPPLTQLRHLTNSPTHPTPPLTKLAHSPKSATHLFRHSTNSLPTKLPHPLDSVTHPTPPSTHLISACPYYISIMQITICILTFFWGCTPTRHPRPLILFAPLSD